MGRHRRRPRDPAAWLPITVRARLTATVQASEVPRGQLFLPLQPVDRQRHEAHRLLRRLRALALLVVVVLVPPAFVGLLVIKNDSNPDTPRTLAERVLLSGYLGMAVLLVVTGACTAILRKRRSPSRRQIDALCLARTWVAHHHADKDVARSFPHFTWLYGRVSVRVRTVQAVTGPWQWWMVEERSAESVLERDFYSNIAHGFTRPARTSWVVWLPGAGLRPWSVRGRDTARVIDWFRDDLQFELESFNRRFVVHHGEDDEAYAHAMAHPRVMDLVGRSLPDGAVLEVSHDAARLTYETRLREGDLERCAAVVLALASLIPAHFLVGATEAGPR